VNGCFSLDREPYLLMRFQERHPPNLPQVHPHWIIGALEQNLALGVLQLLFFDLFQFVGRGFSYLIQGTGVLVVI
jgi:hypothetical protein